MQYALQLAQGGGLPVVRGTAARLGLPFWDEQTQAYQPPLYFAVIGAVARALGVADAVVALRVSPLRGRSELSPGYRLNYAHGLDEQPPYGPGQRVLFELRAVSVLMGLCIVLLVFRLGRRVFPDDPAVAGLGSLLVACFPRFLHESASVHNETLSTLWAQLALLLLLGWTAGAAPRPGRSLLLGLVIGLGVLTKLTCLYLLPLAALVLLLRACASGACRAAASGWRARWSSPAPRPWAAGGTCTTSARTATPSRSVRSASCSTPWPSRPARPAPG